MKTDEVILFGRQDEQRKIDELLSSGKAEFIAVYGRRRVGKTFLIEEHLKEKLTFRVSGVIDAGAEAQKEAFKQALDQHGYPNPNENSWMALLYALQKLLQVRVDEGEQCVVFIDELPCFDTPKSEFIPALDHFWNSWASRYRNMKLIVCGSATSWMIKNLIDSHGGLHNRITAEIHLHPFTLHQTEDFLRSRCFVWTRQMITQAYMVFGGVPYYLTLLKPNESFAQAIDRLYFDHSASLHREYERMLASLFRSPEPYSKIIQVLSKNKQGMMREEISAEVGVSGGRLTKMLVELENCDFIRSFFTREKKIKQNKRLYQLVDMFTLFHLHFSKRVHTDPRFWQNNQNTSQVSVWQGLAFERVVMHHVEQLKQALGIAGIGVEYYAWRSRTTTPASQIDLILDRADKMLNLCEIKFCQQQYVLTKDEAGRLRLRKQNFLLETGSKQGIFLTMITPFGLLQNEYYYEIQTHLTIDDLFL